MKNALLLLFCSFSILSATGNKVTLELVPNKDGAKKIGNFTRELVAGKDQIVTLLDGKLINLATIEVEFLSENFAISGLKNSRVCELISAAIIMSFPYEMKVLCIKPVVKPAE